ncbi:unnamed protein product, partial [Brenthis ino]
MEVLHETPVLKFNVDTLQYLRKQYDLDKPERLEESINHLIDWLKKQDHLLKKDYSREYLERTLIISKGSIEKSKVKLDKICTFRSLVPDFFENFDIQNSQLLNDISCFFLPKMTQDCYRVFMFNNRGQRFEAGLLNIYRYFIMTCEYLQANDYCNGIIGVFDYTDTNIMELLKAINLVELRKTFSIVIEGYGMRLKGLYFITPSKAIDAFVSIIKQAVSSKISQRIQVFKDMEQLHDIIPKDDLPLEYGGKELSIKELSKKLKNELSSKEFSDYFNEMREARTDELYRSEEKFNDQCLGMPGSFRRLTVD